MTSTIEQTAKISPFAPFRRKNFSLLWFADFVSTSGSALTYLAAGILICEITGSALSIGLMLMATAVPSLLVGLLAGVFVDRYDRKKIMFFSDLLRGAEAAPALAAGRPAVLADLDALARRLPALGGLTESERQSILTFSRITDAESGTAIVKTGETSNEAYFLIDGTAIAGRTENENYRVLEKLNAGDFFGEIAAITNVPRTANVVVEEDAILLRVTADGLRKMMENRELNRVFLSKMTERMARMNMIDMPYISGLDEQSAWELRSKPAPAAT